MTTLRTIRRTEVLRKTGLSKTTIHTLEAAGSFPRHFLLTPRVAVWVEHEVDAWLASRIAAPAFASPAPDVSLRRSTPGRGRAASGVTVVRARA